MSGALNSSHGDDTLNISEIVSDSDQCALQTFANAHDENPNNESTQVQIVLSGCNNGVGTSPSNLGEQVAGGDAPQSSTMKVEVDVGRSSFVDTDAAGDVRMHDHKF